VNEQIVVRCVVPLERMVGEDSKDTELLRAMAVEAEDYSVSFAWCEAVLQRYFGAGVGGIVGVCFFGIRPTRLGIDQWLWVVVGDLPSACFVVDQCKTPAQVLNLYISHVKQWIEFARNGKDSSDLIPLSVPPTPEWAEQLAPRIDFLDDAILPRFKDACP